MPQESPIPNIKACVFDAYGTLFDVHSAVGKYNERLGVVADQVSSIWRTKQLEYTWLRSLMKKHADFWQVTQDALDYALDVYNITDKPFKNLFNLFINHVQQSHLGADINFLIGKTCSTVDRDLH